MATVDSLLGQILTVLSDNNAVWDRCCGPNGQGVPELELLDELQAQYPSAGWTLVLLDRKLNQGRQSGLIKWNTSNDSLMQRLIYVFNNFANVNYTNRLYLPFVPQACPQAPCQRQPIIYL